MADAIVNGPKKNTDEAIEAAREALRASPAEALAPVRGPDARPENTVAGYGGGGIRRLAGTAAGGLKWLVAGFLNVGAAVTSMRGGGHAP